LQPRFQEKARRHLRLLVLRSAYSLSHLVYFTAAAGVYWFGSAQVAAGEVTVGRLVALVTLIGMLDNPLSRLVGLHGLVQTAGASADRLLPLFDLAPEADVPHSTAVLVSRAHSITFREVRFSYPANGSATAALSDVTFHIASGERIALVGPSGAGKSTLVSL